jgi:hypothetical protein
MDVKDLRLTPEEWRSLLIRYGIPATSLTGKGPGVPYVVLACRATIQMRDARQTG